MRSAFDHCFLSSMLAFAMLCSCGGPQPESTSAPEVVAPAVDHQQLIAFYPALDTFPITISTTEMHAVRDAPWPMEGRQLPATLCAALASVTECHTHGDASAVYAVGRFPLNATHTGLLTRMYGEMDASAVWLLSIDNATGAVQKLVQLAESFGDAGES